MRSIVIAAAALAGAGCAHLSPGASAIQQVEESQVAACHFLLRIDAGYVPRSAASDLEVQSQKKDALEEAAAKGATHVVWNERRMPERTRITAAAYRCEPTEK